MILLILGLLDVVAGIALGLTRGFPMVNNPLLFYLGVFFILKGLYSLLAAAAAGYFVSVMSWFDLLAGVFHLWANTGAQYPFFLYLGVVMVIKGLYSSGMELMKYGGA